MNPALDIATSIPVVGPTHKMRCAAPRYDPGGGGINVARVARVLGVPAMTVFPSGGPAGEAVHNLLVAEGMTMHRVRIGGATRENFTVNEETTGEQYRFVLPGPELTMTEQAQCLAHLRREPVLVGGKGRPPPLHLLRERVALARAVAQRPGDVADGVLRPVLDHVADLRGPLASVPVEHPLDDLLAPVRVEVHVDVRLLVAQRRQEPFERQVEGDRVDGGDVQQVADRRVGRRPAALAQDAATARLGHDVVHDQEVAGEVLGLDHRQLPFDPLGVRRSQVGIA